MSRRSSRGFTLLELLVVLTIAAAATAFAVPNLGRAIEAMQFRSATREILSALRYARNRAVTHGRPTQFHLDVERRYYEVEGKDGRHPLPGGIDLGMVTAESLLTSGESGVIRFFPDGSSTGGRVSLHEGQVTRHVDVHWLTGQVTLHVEEPE